MCFTCEKYLLNGKVPPMSNQNHPHVDKKQLFGRGGGGGKKTQNLGSGEEKLLFIHL